MVGRNVLVDSRPREIVGVMPQGFRFLDTDFDLIVPLAFERGKLILAGFGYQGIARLKPGVAIAEANADISRMLPIWMDSWSNGPGTNPHIYETWKITPLIRPLKQEVLGNVSEVLWVVMGTIGLVMMIACANVTNLLLVRVESRQQELAVRAALGAGRARIVRGLLVESRAARVDGRSAWRRPGLCRRAFSGGYRSSESAAPERNFDRCADTGICVVSFCALGAIVRIDSCAEIRRTANYVSSAERRTNDQREPGTSPRAQSPGDGPGGNGGGAAGERGADDSHVPGIANGRSGIH